MTSPDAPVRSQSVVPAVDVYVPPHEDDWQLFIGDHFANSVKGTTAKVVLIYSTAGDAGRGAAYWRAREAASKVSVDTIAGAGAWTCATQTVNAHPIQRCVKGKVVSYYMRMPDGNITGDGFGFGSLEQLQTGTATSAIDNSTRYLSWSDFTTTLRAIIVTEVGSNSSPFVQVNAPEYDRTINSGDHADHWATGDATRAAAQDQPWDLGWWVGYRTQNMAVNLTTAAINSKKAEFWQYSESMGNAGYGSPWGEASYQAWLQRTYVRYVDYVAPVPPTAPSNLAVSATFAAAALTWTDNATTEALFRIQRAPDVAGGPGTWADLTTVTANTVSYSDGTIAPSTTYWYRVRAENNAGTSAYTTAVSVTTQPLPPPPTTPTNFLSATLSGSRIDLSWTDVATETSYQLERAPDVSGAPGAYAIIASPAANATGYSDTNLQPNTRYWYRLSAINPGGTSGFATLSAMTSSAFEVDVFVAAYELDWQLFMGDRVNTAIQSAAAQRVVLIYTTAGDGGQNAAYWQARERASRASVDTVIGAGAWNCVNTPVSGHSIQRCDKGKVVAYYMRMPDGFWGDGFGNHGSLELLRSGQATTAIDASTTYTTWADFTNTLKTIITTETGGQGAPYAEINSPDYDATANPQDLPDRYATGQAVQAASQGLHWDLFWYVGQNSQNRPANVTGTALNAKNAEFFAYDRVMYNANYGTLQYEVTGWIPRTYYRFVAGQ